MTTKIIRAGIYARVSTSGQDCTNQLHELRRYCDARGWTATEYVDTGISGSKDRRPALDALMADAAARRIDAVICWRLDRFGRNLRHLVTAIEELTTAGIAFVSMGESIDTTSPTGRLLLGILGSFAEFERERIRERINAGLSRARRQGTKLGRRRERITRRDLERTAGLSVREAAKVLHVPASRVHRERARQVLTSEDLNGARQDATGDTGIVGVLTPFQNPTEQASPVTEETEVQTGLQPA